MRIIDAKQCTAIALGRLGENDYTVVRFDVSAWLNELPGAVIGLYNQRPGDGAAYPVAGITVEGGIVTWAVTSAELTQTGEGKCELVAIAGEVVAKSAIFRTITFDALDGSGEAPEPWEEWQQQLIILKNEAEQAADRAEEAVEHYPRIVEGVWEVWDAQAGAYVSTGISATGPQGERGETGSQGPRGETGATGAAGADGFSPVATVTQTASGATISITDKTGTTTANIANGQDGAPGQPGQDGADGVGVPAGGSTGQVLAKSSGADYSTEWVTPYTGTITETVSGTTPTITAQDNHRYVCGEVSTLDITLPASGIVDVVFQSGSTATVLTITPPTGVTLKWANGFDPTSLDANTTYEINIADGLGVGAAWT